jgi:D-amino-acid dehydrogenase
MRHVIVIGGGVIGLTSCWRLLEAGCRVTLLERAPQVGAGASFANGGQLSYRYVSPLADAGVPLKALGWLADEYGPLRWRPRADARQWRWLASFLAHCRAGVNRRTTARLLALGELSRQEMAALAPVLPPQAFAWKKAGKLVVYRSARAFAAAVAKPDSASEVWDASACLAREPALGALHGQLAGGIYNADEAVADCHAFCLGLAQRIAVHPGFGGIVEGTAMRLAASGGRIAGVQTTAGMLGADDVVLAAGIDSGALAATAGIVLPLYPLKGYSLSAPIRQDDVAPSISVTDFERKVLYARIGDRLRVAAFVDLVGDDARIDLRRLAGLLRQVRATMPRAADYGQATPWAGLRPATPDGAPVIGPTPYANLWLNTGHGGLGFTFAAGSARVLADVMLGKASPIDLTGLALR